MTDYAKFSVRARYSDNSDYSDSNPDTHQLELALTPSEVLYRRLTCSTTAATMDLGDYTSLTGMLVHNRSTTAAEIAYVTVHQQISTPGTLVNVVCTDNGAAPDTVALAGQSWVTTYKAAAGMYVRMTSTTNNGTFLIQVAANASLTLGAGEAISTATENATLYFQEKNRIAICAGGFAVITGSIVPENDLVYQSASGSPELEIFIVGA